MDIHREIQKLQLPLDSFMVVGSGILAALNIRTSDDIDLIVSEATFSELKKRGWRKAHWNDQVVLKKGVFDIGTKWMDKDLQQLLPEATWIHGVPFLNLYHLRQWKEQMARDKDLQDLKLIDKYLSE